VIAPGQHAAKVLEGGSMTWAPRTLVARSEDVCGVNRSSWAKSVGMLCPPLFGCRTNTNCAGRGR